MNKNSQNFKRQLKNKVKIFNVSLEMQQDKMDYFSIIEKYICTLLLHLVNRGLNR